MMDSCLRWIVLIPFHKLSFKLGIIFREFFSGFTVPDFLPDCANACIYFRSEVRPTST